MDPRRHRAARTVRWLALSLVAMGAVACAAILGIDERELIGVQPEGGDADAADGTMDGPGADRDIGDGNGDGDAGPLDADANDPSKICEPTACSSVGGSCINGSCALRCDAGCLGTVFTCPPGIDCTIGCTAAGSCEAARCVGGRSCTFDCSASTSCKQGISCESQRCEFLCTGPTDPCKDGLPLACDASVCIAKCSGKSACNKGVLFNATEYCGVTCSGTPSCNTAASPISCIAPDASIICAAGTDTCKDGKPSCYGDYCSIECRDPSSCSVEVCCEAGTCILDAASPTMNMCP